MAIATQSGSGWVVPDPQQINILPGGGTTGQILAKRSAVDADVTWNDDAGGTAVIADGSIGSVKLAPLASGNALARITAGTGAVEAVPFLSLPISTAQAAVNTAQSATNTAKQDSLASAVFPHSGAEVVAATAVAGNAVDFTKGKNSLTLTAAATLTFSGSPATGQSTVLYLTGDTVARVVTWPANVRSVGLQAVAASTSIPANWTGPIYLEKTSAGFDMVGEPIALADKSISGRFETGANDTQVVTEYSPLAGTITKFVAKSTSGTATYQARIAGTNVTTGSLSVTSTQSSATPTAANAIAVGDRIDIVRTADATAVNVDWTIVITPTKA